MITINNDELYKLIKEMKELRDLIPNDTKRDLLRRHKLKIKYQLLEKILADGGLEDTFQYIKSSKNSLLLVEGVEEEAKNE